MARPLPRVTFTVGLTGGIGSGKTTVANLFAAAGASVIDTDEISRRLTGPGGALVPRLREAFGAALVTADAALDRSAMRSLVFADPLQRAKLEEILHPAIRAEADRELAAARGPYAVVVVPLLYETRGYKDRVDRVLVVDCPEPLQVERTARRSGLAPAEVEAIMAAQWPRWRRLQLADDVVWNGADAAGLAAQCAGLDAFYRRQTGATHA